MTRILSVLNRYLLYTVLGVSLVYPASCPAPLFNTLITCRLTHHVNMLHAKSTVPLTSTLCKRSNRHHNPFCLPLESNLTTLLCMAEDAAPNSYIAPAAMS